MRCVCCVDRSNDRYIIRIVHGPTCENILMPKNTKHAKSSQGTQLGLCVVYVQIGIRHSNFGFCARCCQENFLCVRRIACALIRYLLHTFFLLLCALCLIRTYIFALGVLAAAFSSTSPVLFFFVYIFFLIRCGLSVFPSASIRSADSAAAYLFSRCYCLQ